MMILRGLCVVAALAASFAACAAQQLPPPTVVAAPPQARPEMLQWAIEAALAEHSWTVSKRGPGFVEATAISQGTKEGATIYVTHDVGLIRISCLRASVAPQRYDRWMHLLAAAINKYAAGAVGAPPAPRAN
jgi:hypothetical protein